MKKFEWTDGTPVDYANPTTFRGQNPWEGKIKKANPDNDYDRAKSCVFMYGDEGDKAVEWATLWNDYPCDNVDVVPYVQVRGFVCRKKGGSGGGGNERKPP